MATVKAVRTRANESRIIIRRAAGRSNALQPSGTLRERKYAGLPRLHIEEQPAPKQIVSVPIVTGIIELILEAPVLAGEICKQQPDVTLALVGCVVHRHDQPLAARALP